MSHIEAVKNLRAKTGAGILDCQKALTEAGGDPAKAMEWLNKKGIARAEKKFLRSVGQGRVASYLHGEGRIGVLVEVNVETDFAARSEDFKEFTHHLCLHITALNPLFVKEEEVPASLKEKQKVLFTEQAKEEGKKPAVLDKVIEGRINKWLKEVCLMDQIFLPSAQTEKPQTVREALKNMIAKLGENIVIRRFVRLELGEDLVEPV